MKKILVTFTIAVFLLYSGSVFGAETEKEVFLKGVAYAQKDDYGAAISHLNYAIRKRPNEDTFYYLLASSYREKGDAVAAQRWLARAQEVTAADARKRKNSLPAPLLNGSPSP